MAKKKLTADAIKDSVKESLEPTNSVAKDFIESASAPKKAMGQPKKYLYRFQNP